MKMLFIAILALAAFVSAAKCDYDSGILAFQKRMNKVEEMKGAEKAIVNETENAAAVRLRSKTLKSGIYMGKRRSEFYVFGGCTPFHVIVTYSDPDTKEVASQATAFLRPDGNLRAICGGNSEVTVTNPIDGTIEPNKDCTCYDENSVQRPFGKYGCLYEDEIEEMIRHNNGSGGGILGDIMRNGTRVK